MGLDRLLQPRKESPVTIDRTKIVMAFKLKEVRVGKVSLKRSFYGSY